MGKWNIQLLVLLVATLLSAGIQPSIAAQQKPSRDQWMGIYSGVAKIGYSHEMLKSDTLDGKRVYRLEKSIVYRYSVDSIRHNYDCTTNILVDDQFEPIVYSCTEIKDDHKNYYEARFTSNSIKYKSLIDGTITTKTIDVPEGTDFSFSNKYIFGEAELAVGQKFKLTDFHLPDGQIFSVDMTVLRDEKVDLDGKSYNTIVTSVGYFQPQLNWLKNDGQLIRQETAYSGNRHVVEPKKKAVRGVGKDYPSGGGIQTKFSSTIPNAMAKLNARITGIMDKQQLINDERQAVKAISDDAFEYSIVAESFDPSMSLNLPIAQDDFKKWQDPSPSIQSDDAVLKGLATQIVGNETNAYEAAIKLKAWVYRNVEYKENTTTNESAIDIFKAKNGCCRHKAILYAALARSVGIPTRLVQGITCMGKGFGHHMWAESYVGSWVALDPTINPDFVDATHIKFAAGNMEDLCSSWNNRHIPAIKLEVISGELIFKGKSITFDEKTKSLSIDTQEDGTLKISKEKR